MEWSFQLNLNSSLSYLTFADKAPEKTIGKQYVWHLSLLMKTSKTVLHVIFLKKNFTCNFFSHKHFTCNLLCVYIFVYDVPLTEKHK